MTVFTRFGACPNTSGGVSAIDTKYGHNKIVRYFYGHQVPGALPTTDRDYIVSFKLTPSDVKNGVYDSDMHSWFHGLPAGRKIYWSFWHEPEDEISAGTFSAADYKAAWARLRTVADNSGSPAALRATPILMAWTMDSSSGRHPSDYYPGDNVAQVLGYDFDGYQNPPTGYPDFTEQLAKVQSFRANHGNKPWLVAEFGCGRRSSPPYSDDSSGDLRSQWLWKWANEFNLYKANETCYFDFPDSRFPNQPLTTASELRTWSYLVSVSP